jgi:hypothetical protein
MTQVHLVCQASAKECLKQARSARTLLVMTRFESLAHSWLRLADELERAEALRERFQEPTLKAS